MSLFAFTQWRGGVRSRFVLALAVLLLFVPLLAAARPGAAAPATPTAAPLTVQTADGPVRGAQAAGYRVFQGLPYAAPPVGDRRWQAPQPVSPWTAVRDATASGPACLPTFAFSPTAAPAPAEDCLTLDLTIPDAGPDRATPGAPVPVMVWLHGGAFVAGAGSEFDAARLAVQGEVIVVTINYRLGPLGFLNLPGLADGGGFGLLDQQAALRWVQRNIAAFGGDPANVTLFGESAGGLSVCAQLASPAAQGLFQRAIIQSGPCDISWPAGTLGAGLPGGAIFVPPTAAATASRALAVSLGCLPASTLDCLRQVAAATVQTSPLAFFASFPTIAPPLLPAAPAAALAAGEFPPVPVIVGGTRDELSGAADLGAPATGAVLRARLVQAFGPAGHDVAAAYAGLAGRDPARAWATILSDRVFACPTWRLLNDLAAHTTVYAFEFADPAPPVPAGQPPARGAYHSSEVQYLLPLRRDPAPLDPAQAALSAAMIAYWSAFAHTGDPNQPGQPVWPAFTTADPTVLALAPGPAGIAPTDYATRHQCGLWATVPDVE